MNFEEHFPLLNNRTYLNTASSGILSASLMEWRRAHDQDFFDNGSAFRIPQAERIEKVRASIARFFHSKPENTYLVPNFSYGFNIFLEGLSSEHRFLLLEEDYPSVNYAVQSRGFHSEYIAADESETYILDKIGELKPTVFAFSIVQYISGNKVSLTLITEIKRLYPEILIVADGTQFCGTTDFNFAQSGIDVLISSGYKWMLAGYGNGFILMKDQVKNYLYRDTYGRPLPTEPFLKDKQLLSLYFEPGHQDTLAFGSLEQSILFMEKIGMTAIEHQISKLSGLAKTAFIQRGLLDENTAKRSEHSSIFNLNISEHTYQQLLDADIVCLARGKGIRIAFHFYNTEADLNRLLEVIDRHNN